MLESGDFALEMAVRDYECDMQGVVNNAVYQNYLEHARHEFLRARGVDFAALARAGINLVVLRAELDYRHSLSSGDRFVVYTRLLRESRLKFQFLQHIDRSDDGRRALDAKVTGVALDPRGRPYLPPQLLPLLDTIADPQA